MGNQGDVGQRIHEGQPVLASGVSIDEASAAMIMVHGRGATAESILELSAQFDGHGFAFIAPQASNSTWYPYSFLEPIEKNEPYLSSALDLLSGLIKSLGDSGIPSDRIVLLGFSQGACLATEYAARNARRYGGVVGLSGGLIGPPGTPRDYQGSLDGTPAFLGCSDIDFHIPVDRVHETDEVLRAMGADVTLRIYPGMGHTINRDELEHVQRILTSVSGGE